MLSALLQMFVLVLGGWVNEEQRAVIDYLKEENRVLRELHGRKRLRFTDDQRRRLAAKGRALGRGPLHELGSIVTPNTILRWHRELIVRKYDGSLMRGPGRPAIAGEIRSLAVRMASENESWDYTRIVGELSKLGHKVSRSTVRRILKERGIGLVRYWVFFVIDLPTRRVEIAGIAPVPNGLWMQQVGRNLIDDVSGFLKGKGFLIHDRDPLFRSSRSASIGWCLWGSSTYGERSGATSSIITSSVVTRDSVTARSKAFQNPRRV